MMLRNRDSWRIGTFVMSDADRTVVISGYGLDVWPNGYVQTITPKSLDEALMELFGSDQDAYHRFVRTLVSES